MAQTTPQAILEQAEAAVRDNLSTRLGPTLSEFVDEVAEVRHITRSQVARLLISVVHEQIDALPKNRRATAIKQLG